jgi:hypothetical protein
MPWMMIWKRRSLLSEAFCGLPTFHTISRYDWKNIFIILILTTWYCSYATWDSGQRDPSVLFYIWFRYPKSPRKKEHAPDSRPLLVWIALKSVAEALDLNSSFSAWRLTGSGGEKRCLSSLYASVTKYYIYTYTSQTVLHPSLRVFFITVSRRL